MADRPPTESDILDLVQAQEKTARELSERLVRLEGLVNKQENRNDKQESRNQGALYAVIIGFFFVVVSVAVQVVISTKQDNAAMAHIYSSFQTLEDKFSTLKEQYAILKAKNPYLK